MKLSAINFYQPFSVNVTWTPLKKLTHGVLQYYEFVFSDPGRNSTWNVSLPTAKNNHEFSGFDPFTRYYILARPVTLEGTGKWSENISVWTDEWGRCNIDDTI